MTPSLLDDSDEDDIEAGPAKKSRPSDQGYFAGLPQPVKSRNIDQTSMVKTIQIIDNEEVTHEDSDIVSYYSNTIHGLLYVWAELLYLTCPHEADFSTLIMLNRLTQYF